MRYIVGVLVILGGVAAAIYVGFNLLAVGGLVQIIDGAKANPTDTSMVQWGLGRMVVATAVGYIIVWLALIVGGWCFDYESNSRSTSGNRQTERNWERSPLNTRNQ